MRETDKQELLTYIEFSTVVYYMCGPMLHHKKNGVLAFLFYFKLIFIIFNISHLGEFVLTSLTVRMGLGDVLIDCEEYIPTFILSRVGIHL